MPKEHEPSATELRLIDEQDRLAALPVEPLSPGDDWKLAAIGDALGAVATPLRRHLADALDRIAELERRLTEIETRGLRYRGVWQRADRDSYRHGDTCTYDGSLWIAVGPTTDEPGKGPGWQLAAKAGRDAKGIVLR